MSEQDYDVSEEKSENQRVNIWSNDTNDSSELASAAAAAAALSPSRNNLVSPDHLRNRANLRYFDEVLVFFLFDTILVDWDSFISYFLQHKKLESNDSGNEDSDNFEQIYNYHLLSNQTLDDTKQINLIANNDINSNSLRNLNRSALVLNERLIALSCKNESFKPISRELVESLPTEGKFLLV